MASSPRPLNNLEMASLALKKKGRSPVVRKGTNLERARIALAISSQGNRGTSKFTTATEEMMRQAAKQALLYGSSPTYSDEFRVDPDFIKQLAKLDYEIQYDPRDITYKSVNSREEYRARMMKEIINQSYDQLAQSSRPIYKTKPYDDNNK